MRQRACELKKWACAVLVTIAPAALAQEVSQVDAVPESVILAYDSPELQLPPAVVRSGLTSRTAELLGDAFSQPGTSVNRRVELVRDLGRSMLPEAGPFIRKALADESEQVRATAAWAAAASLQTELADDLLQCLDDPSPQVRAAVVAAHATLSAERDQPSPAVIAGLKDNDASVRLAAITHVRVPGEGAALRDLLSTLTGSAKLEAIHSLAQFNDPHIANTLAALLDEADVGVRAAAIAALGQMRATAHAHRIEAFLEDDHPTIRRAAVAALPGVSGADRAREIGERMLGDPDLSVQAAAAAIIAPVRTEQVATALVDRLASPYQPLHDVALATLTQPANDQVRQVIIDSAVKLLDIPSARRREDAAVLLGTFRSDAGIEKLIKLLETRGWETEAFDVAALRAVTTAVGLIGDARAVPALESIIDRGATYLLAAATGSGKSEDALAGGAVEEALVAYAPLGEAGAVKRGLRVLGANPEFMPSEARQAAAWAIGQAGQPGDTSLRDPLLKALNTSDSEGITFEVIKTIGRLRLADTHTDLLSAAEQTSSPRVRWIALWAIAQITGQIEPYVTPVATQIPSLVIQDHAGR